MKQLQKASKKHIGQLRKHSISQKTRSDYSNQFNPKQQPFSPFINKSIKNSMGRKYAQQHLFKQSQKQHHQIVISDQVVKNSKLFKMLKQKIQTNDAIYVKEMNELNQIKTKLKHDISISKSQTYNHKLSLWQLKNQILEMRGILNDEQQQSRRLEIQISNTCQQYYHEEEERQMEQHQHQHQQYDPQQQQGQQDHQNHQDHQDHQGHQQLQNQQNQQQHINQQQHTYQQNHKKSQQQLQLYAQKYKKYQIIDHLNYKNPQDQHEHRQFDQLFNK